MEVHDDSRTRLPCARGLRRTAFCGCTTVTPEPYSFVEALESPRYIVGTKVDRRKFMNSRMMALSAALLVCFGAVVLRAQDGKPGPLSTPELKQLVPTAYFFRGQSATVQVRNASGFRAANGKLVFAALVDTSGYAHDVAEKYQ